MVCHCIRLKRGEDLLDTIKRICKEKNIQSGVVLSGVGCISSGRVRDASGVLVEDAGANPAHFALMFQFEGDVNAKRTVLYNCVAARPQIAGSTKEENIEPQTESISITATTIYNAVLNKDLVKASCTETSASAAYNGWLSAVYQTTTT